MPPLCVTGFRLELRAFSYSSLSIFAHNSKINIRKVLLDDSNPRSRLASAKLPEFVARYIAKNSPMRFGEFYAVDEAFSN